MMTITKPGGATASPSPKAESHHTECCMCGDLGLSSELFRCKICHFRSQHRYCSNIYPRAESYRACNWCLSEKEGSPEKTQNPVNSSSSNRSTTDRNDSTAKIKKKISGSSNSNVKSSSLKVSVNNRSIKKQKSSPSPSPESKRSPVLAARKRITITGCGGGGGGGMKKENLRRTKSDIPKTVAYKHGFRNTKVRRYKLLDEVST